MSRQEEDLLRLVAYSYTYEEIAERLVLGLEHVMILRSAAMRKAHLASRVDVLWYARERGWLSKENYRLAVHDQSR